MYDRETIASLLMDTKLPPTEDELDTFFGVLDELTPEDIALLGHVLLGHHR